MIEFDSTNSVLVIFSPHRIQFWAKKSLYASALPDYSYQGEVIQ